MKFYTCQPVTAVIDTIVIVSLPQKLLPTARSLSLATAQMTQFCVIMVLLMVAAVIIYA
jgi:hypothetical protein